MKFCFIILFTFSMLSSQDSKYTDSTKVRNPSYAWKLGIIPGLGQIYNRKYIKATLFIGAEYFAINRFIEFKKEGRIGLRNTYAWWTFGLFVWNVLDSYVDAHLSTFPVKRLEFNSIINDSTKVNNN
tara:strand:+ start:512 stop:892 length:381 start_codon:yes stop_codon:yes gene_type:complete